MTKKAVNHNYGEFNSIDDVRKGCTQKYPTSILCFSKTHPSKSRHATEKSVDCLRWLIRTYSNPNDVVMDNCMGSGSTGVACVLEGRSFVGIEKDTGAYSTAEERVYGAYDIMCASENGDKNDEK